MFPEINFPADQFSAFMADIYARAGDKAKAAAKMRDIAKAMEEQLRFHQSLSPDFQTGYRNDYQYSLSTAQTLLRMAEDMKDEALVQELENMFMPYVPQAPPPPPMPGVRQ